jgi:glutamate dehydrogenase/leucine dehydrogenase
MVVEAANGPLSAEAGDLLEDRGIHMIPDILANAGGVTCSTSNRFRGTRIITGGVKRCFTSLMRG